MVNDAGNLAENGRRGHWETGKKLPVKVGRHLHETPFKDAVYCGGGRDGNGNASD